MKMPAGIFPVEESLEDYRNWTIPQTAEFLGVTPRYISELLRQEELEGFLVGPKSRRVLVASVERLIERRRAREQELPDCGLGLVRVCEKQIGQDRCGCLNRASLQDVFSGF